MSPHTRSGLFYRADSADQPVAISLNLDLMDRLNGEVINAFQSVPKRGLEIGGLLLGRIEDKPEKPVVVVEAYEVLKSQHLYGPSFSLSPGDRERLAERVARWSASANSPGYLVGLFRSDTGADLNFSERDLALAREFLPATSGMLLLIKPQPSGISSALIGIRRDETLRVLEEFPFQGAAIRESGYPLTIETMSEIAPEEQPAVARVDAAIPVPIGDGPGSGAAHSPSWRNALRWIWVPVLAAAAIAAAVLWRQYASSSAPVQAVTSASPGQERAPGSATRPRAIPLDVLQSGPELKLTWNHDADTIRDADLGVVEIRDGAVTRKLLLDNNELRTGSVSYSPATGDVQFQLQVFGTSPASVGSVRYFWPGYRPAAVAPQRPNADATRLRPGEAKVNTEIASASPGTGGEKGAAPLPGFPNGGETRNPGRPAVAPPEAPAASRPAPARPAPAHTEAPPAPTRETSRLRSHHLIAVSFEPLAATRNVFSFLAHLGHKREFVPAKPVHEATPQAQYFNEYRGPMVADVWIQIDKQGQVTKSILEDPGASGALASVAVAAARNWKFSPALDGMKPVESEAVLHFHLEDVATASATP